VIHTAIAGAIRKDFKMYYTCKFGVGHVVDAIELIDGEWVPVKEKIMIEKVMIEHKKGGEVNGVTVRYVGDDGRTYSEDEVHNTLIDANVARYRKNKLIQGAK